MGEALITRRGGGGGSEFAGCTFVEYINGDSTSSALDPSKVYLLTAFWADIDSTDSITANGAAYLLKDGVVTVVAATNTSFINHIVYNASTSTVTLYSYGDDSGIRIYEVN